VVWQHAASTLKINQLLLFRVLIDVACGDRKNEIHSVENIQNLFFYFKW